MSRFPPALTSAYEACLNEAFRQSPSLIQRWCTQLVDALYERSLKVEHPEKRRLQNAISALKRNQEVIESGFPAVLADAIAQDTDAAATEKAEESSRSLSSVSFDDLELMGENQIQETVDRARLLQIVSLACEAGLTGLSARLSTAQGFKVVKADKNPLRPEIVSLALLKLLQDLPADSAAQSRWLTHGALILGTELQTLYVLLNEQLIAQGVMPAAYGFVGAQAEKQARDAAAGGSGSDENRGDTDGVSAGAGNHGQAASGGAPSSAGAGNEALLTLDRLHRLLVGEYDESFKDPQLASDWDPAAQQDFSHTVPTAMDVLTELTEKGTATTWAKKSRVAPPSPLAQMRAQLKVGAKSLGQSLAIEVVGLMIEQMANDPRLLEPVRQIIAHSEPAFLRLGVTDPRFFSDKAHPARRLLEVITAKSLAYSTERATGFAEFMEDLHGVAALLTEEHATDAQHFASLLKTFENCQALRSSSHRASQNLAVRALLQAEQRNLLAEKIAPEIRARSDFVRGNRIITAFLTGPWAQVLARERLQGEHDCAGAKKAEFGLTLGDMLWSLDPVQTAGHVERLMKIIPGMLEGVRAGLLSIDFPLEHSKVFFDEMMRIHRAAFDVLTAPPETKKINQRRLEDAFDVADDVGRKRTWLTPEEVRDFGFMDDSELETRPAFELTKPQVRDDEPLGRISAWADAAGSVELHPGAWVELVAEDSWLRAQLTWISPYSTLYMFTSEGGRTHSMTGPLLQYLLLQDRVRVISQQGVLEGALDTVARTAMRNSLDSKNPH